MHYRILAAGPIIAGNATIPHRLVLVAWTYDPTGPIAKLSVHTQQFFGPDFPKRRRSTALFNGDYFTGDDREVAAPLRFAARLDTQIRQYGRDIDVRHPFDQYESAQQGQA
jgi:hypothetical protein